MTGAKQNPIPVVAAVVSRRGRVLLCQRRDGEHLPLLWEFPGGKVDPGEGPGEALERELREELGVGSKIGGRVAEVFHTYPSKRVWIRFYRAAIVGQPEPIVHRAVEWVATGRLHRYRVPPPNRVVIEGIRRGELAIH